MSVTTLHGGILPVELVYFTAKAADQDVLLQWQTASETNNEGFEIYRSQDGLAWDLIAYEPGVGTTTEQQNYDFLDKTAWPGQNYYRLRQIDYDGAFEFSEVVIVNKPGLAGAMQVFPNPAYHEIFVYGKGWAESDQAIAKLTLFDAFGQQVKYLEYTIQKDSPIPINVEELSNGIYFLEMRVGQQTYKSKIVKQ